MSRPRPSRRRVLAAGAALLVAGPAALAGCTGSPAVPERPDPLEPPARRAETDSALAQAVAQMAAQMAGPTGPQTHPALATAASALAADRMAHAITLRAELRRVRPASTPSSAAPPAAPAPPLADPDLASARAALLQAMHAAQDEATQLVLTLPGYRAALLASVAACCATHAAVLP
ncbi:MAG: hypothetical protein ACRDUV_26760 [Pseudonocardiaceae bacterium]